MANDTGNAVHKADKANIINPSKLEDVAPERKDQFLNRVKKEQIAVKVAFEKVDEWIEVVGKKVLIRKKNKAGSAYSSYLFNRKKNEIAFNQMLKDGGIAFDPENPKKITPLKTVDGRDFKKASK